METKISKPNFCRPQTERKSKAKLKKVYGRDADKDKEELNPILSTTTVVVVLIFSSWNAGVVDTAVAVVKVKSKDVGGALEAIVVAIGGAVMASSFRMVGISKNKRDQKISRIKVGGKSKVRLMSKTVVNEDLTTIMASAQPSKGPWLSADFQGINQIKRG